MEYLESVGGSGEDPCAAGNVFIEATVGVSKHRQLHVDVATFGDVIICSHLALVVSAFSEVRVKAVKIFKIFQLALGTKFTSCLDEVDKVRKLLWFHRDQI